MKRAILLYFMTVILTGTILVYPAEGAAQSKINKVRAVFLFKFFDYITWPSGYVPGVSGDGVLCTLGGHNFKDTLGYIAARKSDDFRYHVKKIYDINDISGCHILYVNPKKYKDVSALQSNGGILTVGSENDFLNLGGIMQMKERDGKIRLLIDLKQARKQGLKISSRLLDIAEVKK